MKYLTIDHPQNQLLLETDSEEVQKNALQKRAKFQDQLIRAVGAHVYQELPTISELHLSQIMEAAEALLTGETDLLTNAKQTGHQTGRFNYLWRGRLKGDRLQCGKRKKRPKKQRKKQRVQPFDPNHSLTEEDAVILATGLLKRVQKHAVTPQVTRLCWVATEDSWYYAPKVTSLEASDMITARQQNQPVKYDLNLRTEKFQDGLARKRASGTLQELLGDKRTHLESVFTHLHATAQSYVKWANRVDQDVRAFFQDMQGHPADWAAYLLFGERRFASMHLSRRWQLDQGWVHSWLAGVRRLMDSYVPERYWIYPHEHLNSPDLWLYTQAVGASLSVSTFQKACQQKLEDLDHYLLTLQGSASARTRILTFRKKIQLLHAHAETVVAILCDPQTPLQVGREMIREKAHQVKQALDKSRKINRKKKGLNPKYRSALVAILSLAAIDQDPDLLNPQRVDEWLTSEHCLSLPFQKRKNELQIALQAKKANIFARDPRRDHLQPLLIVWKPTQLIQRPTYPQITRLLRIQGYFDLTVTNCTLPLLVKRNDPRRMITTLKRARITLRIYATPKMQDVLTNGAEVEVLRLMPPRGPAHKIDIDLVFKGEASMFRATKHLSPPQLESYQAQIKFTLPKKEIIVVDTNRMSEHILALNTAPEDRPHSPLSPQLLRMCERFHALEQPLTVLQSARDKAATKKRLRTAHKHTFQHELAMRRRCNLRFASHARCSVELASHLALSQSRYLVTEPLSINPKGSRKHLAKATFNMPDDPEIFHRAVENVKHALKHLCEFHHLSLDGQSLRHVGCPGWLQRDPGMWDFSRCSVCGKLVNTHRNSALRDEKRFQDQLGSKAPPDSYSPSLRPSSHQSANKIPFSSEKVVD